MGKLAVSIGAAALGFGAWTTAQAYTAEAQVTFAWGGGGNGASTLPAGWQIAWTSNGNNSLSTLSNETFFTAQAGFNSTSYFNPDFALASDYDTGQWDDCLTPLPLYETVTLRKFACRHTDAEGEESPMALLVPVTDVGPGAAASGTVTVTDTTLTGTLTVIQTTDEPTGATTTIVSGVRISNSTGNGSNGYNLRTADGSPFGNAWYGVTQAATLTLNLTGSFSETSWQITGGTVRFTDPGFACQQGGFGGDGRGTLCTPTGTGGGFAADAGGLSWGMDTDGANPDPNALTAIDVRDAGGTLTIATLSGVLASLAIDGNGVISTETGEYRYATGSAGGGCPTSIRWDGARISCGLLGTGPLSVSGVVDGDSTPDPFSFVDLVDVARSTTVTSAPVLISGIDVPAPVAVSGGAYSVDCQPSGYMTAAGTIAAGQTVCVRHQSAAGYGGTTATTLTIGGVSDTFSSTTVGSPPPGQATTYDIYGKMAKLTNVCFNIAVSLTSNDCSYAKTRDPTGNWRGPIEGSSFYPIGSPGDSISYVPTPNDGKYAMPLSGTLTIDDNGTPADGRDDLISGTFVFGAAAFNASTGNGDRAVERWSSWTHTMAPTQVDAAEAQPGGGFRYRIGSRGEPTPAPLFILGNPTDTFPSENARGTLDAPPIWDASGATLTPSSTRVGIERSRGFGLGGTGNVGATTTAVFEGYSCVDNPGDSDCAGLGDAQTSSAILFGPNRNGTDPFSAPFATTQLDPDSVPLTAGFSNVILLLTTDGNGGISSADAYWTREYIIRNGPDLSGDEPGAYKINNSWGGGRFSFSTDPPPTAPTAVDDIATALSGVTTAIAVLGNDELGSPEPHTLSVEEPPANGQAVAGTGVINYTPNAGFSGTDSFRYRLTDGDGDLSTATVSVTVPDAIPMAVDFFYQTFFGNPTPPFAVLEYPTLLGNGTAADHALAITDQGEIGFCSLVGGDRIRYQPIAGRGDGPDSCTYRITDLDGDADEGMIYVYVYANPTAPDLARDDFAATPRAQSVVIDVLTNDTGFSDPVTVGLFTVPLHGNVTVTGSPGPRSGIVLTYTPAPGFEGEDYFDYAVDDGNQADVARVTVRVAQDLGPDGDGVTQSADNCTAVYNPDQRDTNGDGYGNLCDGDLDNNGFVNFADLGLFRQQFGSPGPDADFNGNGVVNFADLGVFRGLFGKPPGPSGVAAP